MWRVDYGEEGREAGMPSGRLEARWEMMVAGKPGIQDLYLEMALVMMDRWKKESGMVLTLLTWIPCGQFCRGLRMEEIRFGAGGIDSPMLHILSVSSYVP